MSTSPSVPWEFRQKGDVWEFIDEDISAVGSEMYPWNPAVVKAIREFEPDFCPLWVRSVYRAPSGGYKVFGRHAIGIDVKHHWQEGAHRPMKVWTATYGINKGRRPILVESLIQNEKIRVIPDLNVFGYAPLDWGYYYKLHEGWYQTRNAEADHDKAAEQFVSADDEATSKAKASLDSEADYRFDHETNRGLKVKGEVQSMTHEDWRRMGVS